MTYFMLKIEKSSIEKTNLEVLQLLLDKLQLYQQALRYDFIGKNQLIAATLGNSIRAQSTKSIPIHP